MLSLALQLLIYEKLFCFSFSFRLRRSVFQVLQAMSVKLFYTDYSKDEHVRSDEAKDSTLEEIVECMNKLLHEPDNFIGLIDAEDTMLQFMVEDDGSICVDSPVDDKNGSFTKNATLKESVEIVQAIQTAINLDAIKGLQFKKW